VLDSSYLTRQLKRDPREDELLLFSEKVSILLCSSGGAGEEWSQFEAFEQIYGDVTNVNKI
jgi:hypothetical protein